MRKSRSGARASLVGLLVTCLCADVWADEDVNRVQSPRDSIDLGGRFRVLSEGRAMPHERPHLGPGVIPTLRYFEWKVWVKERHGLNYFFGYTPQVQLGSVDTTWHANSELDFVGGWDALKRQRTKGTLDWWLRWNQTLSRLTTRQFSDTQLLALETNDGDTGSRHYELSVATLEWEQYFFDTVGFRIGQINSQTTWGNNDFLDDDRSKFMALPLTGPYGAAFMEAPIGLGLHLGVWNDWTYFVIGLQEATANQFYPDFQSLARGDLAYFAEFAFTPDYLGPNEGAYRFTYSYIGRTGNGPNEGPGHSVVVSAQQRIIDRWGLFARYTQSFKRLPEDFRLAVVAGFIHLQPFNFHSDKLGVAYIYDRPTDSTRKNEHGMEFFWRFQLTQLFSVTPDLQLYFTPAQSTDNNFGTVITLRLQLAI